MGPIKNFNQFLNSVNEDKALIATNDPHLSEEMCEKIDELMREMLNEMKACHEDETDRTARGYLAESKEYITGSLATLTRNCESYIKGTNEGELYDVKKKVKKGKMHDLLGVPQDKEIADVYKDPKKLAQDLVKATGGDQKEATGMLAFAANINPANNIFDQALKAMKDI